MNRLNSAVVHGPTFEKVAGIKLPKNAMDWNEVILKQFYAEHSNIPSDYKVDAVVNNSDDKAGYAKGSIVVWNGSKKINFPVIVKDWELSPFDTFVLNEGEDSAYRSATEENITKAMSDERLGETSDDASTYSSTQDVKRPGHVLPKSAIPTGPMGQDGEVSFDKLSHLWKATAHDDDLEKFAEDLVMDPGVQYSFKKNNPDLLTNVINEVQSKRVIPADHHTSVKDVGNYINRKQADTIVDSEIFDVNMLRPVEGAVEMTELRINMFPTLEDHMSSGESMVTRYAAAANGKPIKGIVMDVVDPDNNRSDSKRREQIFISLKGNFYAIDSTYGNRKNFYGMKIPCTKEVLDAAVRNLSNVTTDEMITYKSDRHYSTPGLDKVFAENQNSIDYYKRNDSCGISSHGKDLCIIYGADNAWQAITKYGRFVKKIVNGNDVYVGDNNIAIVKANVATPVYAESTNDPVYGAAIGNKRILLIPEFSIVFNLGYMHNVRNDLLTPSQDIRDKFEGSGVAKVAVQIDNKGYQIHGTPVNNLKKIASLKPYHSFSTDEAVTALYTMGMSKQAAKEALSGLVKKASDGDGNSITIYGVNSDYINLDPVRNMEKSASIKSILKEYANSLRVNLVKEASVVEDPEAVDNILSLNFINEDNILEYAKYTDELRETSDKLSELLVANRMGLKDVDESAIKKSIEGIEDVIQGLNKLKMVVNG